MRLDNREAAGGQKWRVNGGDLFNRDTYFSLSKRVFQDRELGCPLELDPLNNRCNKPSLRCPTMACRTMGTGFWQVWYHR